MKRALRQKKKKKTVWTHEKPDTQYGKDFMAKPKKKNLSETRYNTMLSCCWLLRCDTTLCLVAVGC
jgi:hypothetical protein